MENKFGKTSVVKISSLLKDKKAILDDIYFTAPFKIMKPFKVSDNSLIVMLLTASAGIMEGDVQDITILVREGTNIEFVSQAYEKIHKMNGGNARRITKIKVEKNASLKYSPLPTIPFKDSAFISKIEIELEDKSSQLILSEILSCGRARYGERFQYSTYENLVQVREGKKLIYRDKAIYKPNEVNMSGIGMYEGFTHFANILFCNCNISGETFLKIREYLEDNKNINGNITHSSHGDIIVRVLGNSGDELTNICEEINKIYKNE